MVSYVVAGSCGSSIGWSPGVLPAPTSCGSAYAFEPPDRPPLVLVAKDYTTLTAHRKPCISCPPTTFHHTHARIRARVPQPPRLAADGLLQASTAALEGVDARARALASSFDDDLAGLDQVGRGRRGGPFHGEVEGRDTGGRRTPPHPPPSILPVPGGRALLAGTGGTLFAHSKHVNPGNPLNPETPPLPAGPGAAGPGGAAG